MCRVVGAVGAAEADSGIPEGRYSNPADDPKVPILVTHTHKHTRARVHVEKKLLQTFPDASGSLQRRDNPARSFPRELLICLSFGEEGPMR